jgi:hypothetical protein
MFMQVGFAMVETGFTRAKNVAHTMAMNMFIYVLGITGFWICGFAFMFGGVGAITSLGGTPGLTNEISVHLFGKDFGIIGSAGYFLNIKVYDVGVLPFSCSRWCLWIRRPLYPQVPWPSGGNLSRLLFSACSSPCLFILYMATGFGAAAGWPI